MNASFCNLVRPCYCGMAIKVRMNSWNWSLKLLKILEVYGQEYIDLAGSLEGLSPNVPLYKMNEGNEPCFFTTSFCWDPTKAIDKSNGGNQGPRQRAEALAALNSASTTYHVRKSGNQV